MQSCKIFENSTNKKVDDPFKLPKPLEFETFEEVRLVDYLSIYTTIKKQVFSAG